MAMHHRKISCSLEARRRKMCGAGRSIEDAGKMTKKICWDSD